MFKHPAFTLAELLIALAILGVIATFTIPKVLTAQADQQKKATFKEVIAAMSDVIYTGVFTGELNGGNDHTYIPEHLNAIKICTDNDALAGGCWTQPLGGYTDSWVQNESGFVLATGVSVSGLDKYDPSNGESFSIDYNGSKGPNMKGEDQMNVFACYANTGCPAGQKAGTLLPDPASPEAIIMFEEIFK